MYSIFLFYLDQPKTVFKEGSHTQLQLIKEAVGVDTSSFSFEVGNLGRIAIRGHTSTDFIRMDDWAKKIARKYCAPDAVDQLRTGLAYDKALRSGHYLRVWDKSSRLKDEPGKYCTD